MRLRPSIAQAILDIAYPEEAARRQREEQLIVALSIMAWGFAMRAWLAGTPARWARMDWKGNPPDDELDKETNHG